jgi:hypothetical protein
LTFDSFLNSKKSMAFDAHGSYDLKKSGEIILLRLEGNWNLERAKTFFETYKTFILGMEVSQFGVLTDFRQLEGATPDAIAFFEEISAWARKNGQVARAQILDSDLRAYIVDQGTRNKDLFPIQSFESQAEALDWLSARGLKIS